MSELANQEREVKQRWAVPGSSHDRIIRFAKVALPSGVGALIAFANQHRGAVGTPLEEVHRR